jgi:hypothetical protein
MGNIDSKIRNRVIEHIELLASPSEQFKYEQEVKIACVPDELISGYCADLFHPKSPSFIDAFSQAELKDLAQLYGMLCMSAKSFENDTPRSVANFQKNSMFRETMSFAKDLLARIKR